MYRPRVFFGEFQIFGPASNGRSAVRCTKRADGFGGRNNENSATCVGTPGEVRRPAREKVLVRTNLILPGEPEVHFQIFLPRCNRLSDVPETRHGGSAFVINCSEHLAANKKYSEVERTSLEIIVQNSGYKNRESNFMV